ncbi:EG45-like domain containing protein [Rhododendron vialii]|uniref:EG45-like domain containing protein n=1 Tax=Rhododendron vialii TaxID=182163 RepID=UPI00265D925E|nr:EG45-like domain containing protein [Rhododendron vialii]
MGAKILISILVVISIYLVPMTYAQYMYSGTASVRPAPYADRSCPDETISDLNNTCVAIAGDAVWEGPQTCGTKYFINCTGSTIQGLPCPCTGKSVVVTIVEHCLTSVTCSVNGNFNTFQLSQEAFLEIADPTYPNIAIEYKRVYY